MIGFREKRKLKHLLYSKAALGFILVIVALLVGSVFDVYKKEKNTRVIKNRQEQELLELKDREVALKAEIDRLNSGIGIEDEIRGKFNVGREGEGVAIITDAVDSESELKKDENRGFWNTVFGIFKRD